MPIPVLLLYIPFVQSELILTDLALLAQRGGGRSRQTPFADSGDCNGSDHFELAPLSSEEGKSDAALVSASAISASR